MNRLLAGFALAVGALLACGVDPKDELLTNGKSLYSQGKEELIIRHFFGDRRDGFFVDVGCSHWKDYSTTYYLEEKLGWSGIGIDANPEFQEAYAEHRPQTRFFLYIVTDHSGTKETLYGAGPLSSTSEEWIEQFAIPKDVLEPVEVPTITLDELLDRSGVTKIDLLSMDIEGGEPRALAGFDIERFAPELVSIEKAYGEGAGAIEAYFAQHGYERIEAYLRYDETNWYYRPRQARWFDPLAGLLRELVPAKGP